MNINFLATIESSTVFKHENTIQMSNQV